jgi:hypothetical protein
MMNMNQRQLQVQETYYQDQLRRAAQERLAGEARTRMARPAHWYSPVMAQMGAGLVRWGLALERRSGMLNAALTPSTPRTIAPNTGR